MSIGSTVRLLSGQQSGLSLIGAAHRLDEYLQATLIGVTRDGTDVEMQLTPSVTMLPILMAVIDEETCIGCTKCIQACPVDAIVGASKLMHTVIASWCTGCELCIPPCPVDCIAMSDVPALPDADLSRERHEARAVRLVRDAAERDRALAALE